MIGTVSSARLNTLADKFDVKRYLEVGVSRGQTLAAVKVTDKTGVDPKPQVGGDYYEPLTKIMRLTSDQFFSTVDGQMRFDLVFLDGLHTAEQTAQDLANVLRLSHKRTIILVDDVIPDSTYSADPSLRDYRIRRLLGGLKTRDWRPLGWQGDVFRLFPHVDQLNFLSWLTVVEQDQKAQALIWFNQEGADLLDTSRGRDEMQLRMKEFVARLSQSQDYANRGRFLVGQEGVTLGRDKNIWLQPTSVPFTQDYLRPSSFAEATAMINRELPS